MDLYIYIWSIPTAHLTDFDNKLKASLERIVAAGFDMNRLAMVINRSEREVSHSIELLQDVGLLITVKVQMLTGSSWGRILT